MTAARLFIKSTLKAINENKVNILTTASNLGFIYSEYARRNANKEQTPNITISSGPSPVTEDKNALSPSYKPNLYSFQSFLFPKLEINASHDSASDYFSNVYETSVKLE